MTIYQGHVHVTAPHGPGQVAPSGTPLLMTLVPDPSFGGGAALGRSKDSSLTSLGPRVRIPLAENAGSYLFKAPRLLCSTTIITTQNNNYRFLFAWRFEAVSSFGAGMWFDSSLGLWPLAPGGSDYVYWTDG